MVETAVFDKDLDSPLRKTLKVVKARYDDPRVLRRTEVLLRRALFLQQRHDDQCWHGESLEWLAYIKETEGDLDMAEKLYIQAINEFHDNEFLGPAKALRRYALFLATYRDPVVGLAKAQQALALHDDDFNNLKGHRQRRITESYVWRIRLLIDSEDLEARYNLIDYALIECRDCCPRDQHQTIEAALSYADGLQKRLLEARLVEVYAKRWKLSGFVKSMTTFIIDSELYVASRAYRFVVRRE